MSRSTNDYQESPVAATFQWGGADGTMSYWDPQAGEKGERINAGLPFRFMLLDSLASIRGYNSSLKSGVWSNHVKDIKNDVLLVRNSKGVVATGTYADIKDKATSQTEGGKYCQVLYIAYRDTDGEYKIGVIEVKGSALSGGEYKDASGEKIKVPAWIDFRNLNKKAIFQEAIEIDVFPEVCVNGATKFRVPAYSIVDATDEEKAVALKLDTELQEYLREYLAQNAKRYASTTHAAADDVPDWKNIENKRAAEGAKQAAKVWNQPSPAYNRAAQIVPPDDELFDDLPF